MPTFSSTIRFFGAICLGLAPIFVAGCKDTRTAGKNVYPPKVETITLYGVELGPEAKPEDVAYVLLRVVRDKRQAVRDNDREAKRNFSKALVSLAAPDKIMAHYRASLPKHALPLLERDVMVNEASRGWGPVLSHYVEYFEDDRQAAQKKMATLALSDKEARVIVPVVPKKPNAPVKIEIKLAKENEYWRVWKVGFLDPVKTTQPVTGRVIRKAKPAVPTSKPAASQPAGGETKR